MNEEIHELRLAIDALVNLVGPQKFAAEKLRIEEQLKDEATEMMVKGGGFVRIDEVRRGSFVVVSRCFDGVRESTKQRFPIDTQTPAVQQLFLGKLRNGMVPFEVEEPGPPRGGLIQSRRGVAVIEDILFPVQQNAC